MIRVMLAVRHDITRHGMLLLLEQHPEFKVVAECSSAKEALEMFEFDASPDVLLLDAHLRDMAAAELLRALRNREVHCPVLLWTETRMVEDFPGLLELGVRGIVARADLNALRSAIKSAILGGVYLDVPAREALLGPSVQSAVTAPIECAPQSNKQPADPFGLTFRERQVLELISKGATNREIARSLSIGTETVKSHVRNIMTKLNVRDRSRLGIAAMTMNAS
jgi:two-component system nitrate/nitrite response regulator NarL